MSKVSVSKVINGKKREAVVDYDFVAAYNEASEEVRQSEFRQAATVTLQALLRRALESGKPQEELQKLADGWKPGAVTRTRKDPKEEIANRYLSMSEEQRKELIRYLKEVSAAQAREEELAAQARDAELAAQIEAEKMAGTYEE